MGKICYTCSRKEKQYYFDISLTANTSIDNNKNNLKQNHNLSANDFSGKSKEQSSSFVLNQRSFEKTQRWRKSHPGVWNDSEWGDFQSSYLTHSTTTSGQNESLQEAALRFYHGNLSLKAQVPATTTLFTTVKTDRILHKRRTVVSMC